jgi:hypothetical protein
MVLEVRNPLENLIKNTFSNKVIYLMIIMKIQKSNKMKNTYIMMLTKKVDLMKVIDPNYYQWI